MKEFDPVDFWIERYNEAHRALILAQSEILRLAGERALDNLVVLDFKKPDNVA